MSTVILPENLDIECLPALIKQNQWLGSQSIQKVDFAAVKNADSAILALMLFWAQSNQQTIQVVHFPEQLMPLVELYDLEEVFTFH